MAFTPNAHPPDALDPSVVQGEAPTRRRAVGKTLNLRPTPDFRLKAHPARWECVGGEWLPQLGKMRLEPGLNGIDHRMGEAQARENARQRGWILLDQDTIGFEYVRRYPVRGGFCHLEKWVIVKSMPGNRPALLKPDTAGYNAFRRKLIEDGHVPPIDEDVKAGLIELKKRELDGVRGRAHLDPVIATRAKRYVEELAAMTGATTPAPKPKRKTRKRKAAAKKAPPKKTAPPSVEVTNADAG